MKKKTLTSILPALMLSGLLFSCNKPDITSSEAPPPSTEGIPVNNAVDPTTLPGRTLAANCFQCHGTNGYAGELKIASMGKTEIISKFTSYRTKNPKDDIMYMHAQAYTDAEIDLIADFFSKQ